MPFENKHKEPSDCSGYRGVVGGATRRRKDEILEEIAARSKEINDGLRKEGRQTLTTAEQLLLAWRWGWMLGLKDGKESAKLQEEFRKHHGLGDDDQLPTPRDMVWMERKSFGSHKGDGFWLR